MPDRDIIQDALVRFLRLDPEVDIEQAGASSLLCFRRGGREAKVTVCATSLLLLVRLPFPVQVADTLDLAASGGLWAVRRLEDALWLELQVVRVGGDLPGALLELAFLVAEHEIARLTAALHEAGGRHVA